MEQTDWSIQTIHGQRVILDIKIIILLLSIPMIISLPFNMYMHKPIVLVSLCPLMYRQGRLVDLHIHVHEIT